MKTSHLSRAQISRSAIRRLHIAMRHLFVRGSYKPLGISGESMINALLELKPEIYGSISDPNKVELKGLHYIFQRLPQGIEECSFIKLISREGFENSKFSPIVPAKRRRQCYRIDADQMYIEMVRGYSDIYDILTHLTFMYIEAEKIRSQAIDHRRRKKREWVMLEKMVKNNKTTKKKNRELGYTYLSTLLGRSFEETKEMALKFEKTKKVNSLFNIVYWLGTISIQEFFDKKDRQITFSGPLREKVGKHIFGSYWAHNVKSCLQENKLLHRPLHVISANLHSVMNCFFAKTALEQKNIKKDFDSLVKMLSKDSKETHREQVRQFAIDNGMIEISDQTGVNIGVQLFDLAVINKDRRKKAPVIIVMDYAFGEQAYELMDELIKPFEYDEEKIPLNIESINIMGKAGILEGIKGDIMIPTAHVFEGTADNYPLENKFNTRDLQNSGLSVYKGPMVTVLGTSLQNKDILRYFLKSSWNAIGLEMEGAHYQKAIQAASKIRGSIKENVQIRYAYYASDNPLETGSTLASGGLGVDGVKPTYLITKSFLKSIMS